MKGIFMRKILFALSLFLSLSVLAREMQSLDKGWQFVLNDASIDELPDVEGWRNVDVPHDWSIEDGFDRSNPTGQGGAYLPAGTGWYRKTIKADIGADERLFLEFDGVMACSSVYVDGKLAGYRPNGYVGFTYDITDLVTPGKDAVVAVKVDNSVQPASRWYTGSGINRHVRLVSKNSCHIPTDGVFVSLLDGKINIKTNVSNASAKARTIKLQYSLKDAKGKVVAKGNSTEMQVEAGSQTELGGTVQIKEPQLWSPDNPYLYTVDVELIEGRKQLDAETVTIGLRTIRFDNKEGFFINDKNLKMYGVCLHSDAGGLGTAVPASVWEYRLTQLKKLGVNAIRMAHNPADPTLYDLCDRMGFLVMAESFDTWNTPKNHAEKGYNLYFDEWWERDTRAMVEQARNHPCVVIYSVGNEIRDNLNNEQGFDKYRMQQDLIHELDPTRPVTMALFRPNSSGVYKNGFAEMMDVVGQNYRVDELKAYHEAHPEKAIIGTENTHDIQSWLMLRDDPSLCGQFLWAGIDYLGEATWPQVMWSTSLLDVTGGVKPAGMQRASWWTKEPMVAFARHADNNGAGALVSDWTPADMDTYDQAVIEVYSNCQEVDLWINGEPQGRRPMPDNARPALYNVNFTPGVINVRGYNDGIEAAKCYSVTVGDPKNIVIEKIGGRAGTGFDDVEILSVFIADAEGNVCPNNDCRIELKVDGADLIAVDNADVLAHETTHKSAVFNTYQGRMIAYIRRTSDSGRVTVTATDCSSAAALNGSISF
jgi:beta-galactosidase